MPAYFLLFPTSSILIIISFDFVGTEIYRFPVRVFKRLLVPEEI